MAVLRALIRPLAALAALGLFLAGTARVLLDQTALRDRLRPAAEALLGKVLSSEVSIGRIAGVGVAGIELEDVSVVYGGEPALQVPRARVGLAVQRLFPPRIGLGVDLDDFALDLRRDPAGEWNVAGMFASDSDEPPPVWLRAVTLGLHRGSAAVHGVADGPLRFHDVEARGVVDLVAAGGPLLAVDRLDLRAEAGSSLRASGWIGFAGETPMSIELSGDPIAGADLRRWAPSWPADRAATGWALFDGSLDAPRGDVHLASGTTTVEAWARLAAPPDGVTALERPLSLSVAVRDLDPRLVAADAPAGKISAAGSLGAGLAGDGSLRMPVVEARAWASSLGEVRADWASLQARREGANWKIAAQAAAPKGAWRGDATASVADVAPHAASAEFRLESDDPGSLSASLREAMPDAALRVEGTARTDRLDEGRTVEADLRLDRSRVRGVVLDEARARLRAKADLVELRDVVVRAAGNDLSGAGWLRTSADPKRRALGGDVSGTADLGVIPGCSGPAPFSAKLWGRPDDAGARIDLRPGGAVDTPAGRARLRGSIDLAALGSDRPSAKAKLSGGFEPKGPAGELLGKSQDVDLAGTWARAAGTSGPAAPSDSGDLDVTAHSPDGRQQRAVLRFERDARSARVDLSQLRVAPVEGPAWTLEHPAKLALDAGGLDVGALALHTGATRLALDGRLVRPGSDRPGRITLEAHQVDLGPFCKLAGRGECGGRIDAHLLLAGAQARPEVSGKISAADLSFADQVFGNVELGLHTEHGLVVDGRVDSPLGGHLAVGGTVPLAPGWPLPQPALEHPLSMRVHGEEVDLAGLREFVPPGTFSELRGRALLDVSVAGSAGALRFSGEAKASDVTLGLAATGMRLRNGRIALHFAGDRAEVVEFSAEDGKLTGGGHVELPSGESPRLDLSLDLAKLKVYDKPIATAVATGRLRLLGTLAAPEIEGDVTLDPVTIRPSLLPGSGGAQRDPTIVVWNSNDPGAVRPGDVGTVGEALESLSGKAATASGREGETYRRMRVAVRVLLGESVGIRRNDADIRLGGELWATKDPGDEVRISGQILSTRGWYVFQGRRLELEHAWVTFSGESPVDPYLNVAAIYRDAQYRITVAVQGTAQKPSLDLSSEPSLDQSDILAMLLFGKPASQLTGGQGQGLQQEALGLLASYVAPGLERSVIDTLGLTSLTFQMPSGASAGSIGVGRYLGEDLFVSISQDLGGSQTSSTRQQQGLVGSSVVVQYYLSPSVTIQGAASSQGESSVDVIWHMRFGGVKGAATPAAEGGPEASPMPSALPSPAPSVGHAPGVEVRAAPPPSPAVATPSVAPSPLR